MIFPPSLFEKHFFDKRLFYIKRDDLLHPDFSGNKARKFEYFLAQDLFKIKRVVSYGSNQSNAMYSLSVLAKMRNWSFMYFCDHVPSFLKQNPVGNYKYALQNGMLVCESQNRANDAHLLADETTLVIEEGGRQKEAEFGVENLAHELLYDIERCKIKDPYIFLPSGTGTTALFLQKHLAFDVYTCSTVGDDDYLMAQWKMLDDTIEKYPIVLDSIRKYHYGKLYKESYAIWKKLKISMGMEFDMLYDPVGWIKLLENIDGIKGTPIYIHQGGLRGNESMQARYDRKYGKIN